MIVAGEEGSLGIDGVGDSTAETVTLENHCEIRVRSIDVRLTVGEFGCLFNSSEQIR